MDNLRAMHSAFRGFARMMRGAGAVRLRILADEVRTPADHRPGYIDRTELQTPRILLGMADPGVRIVKL